VSAQLVLLYDGAMVDGTSAPGEAARTAAAALVDGTTST
jgi:hypothetical protein